MSNADPVPSIREADASGEIADLYDDIRTTLGVPVVNLIWRHLAIFPGGLAWVWTALKPVYASGAVAAEAAELRDGLDVPRLPGLTQPALVAAGLTGPDLAQINMILNSYEQSNAMNIIALAAVSARLEGVQTGGKTGPSEATGAVQIEGEMPPLLTLDDMTPEVRALVQALNAVGGREEILASMYRHLANWPPYLGLVSVLVTPFAEAGELEWVIQGVIAEGRRRAAGLVNALDTPGPVLEESVEADVRAALNRFIDGPIGKMIAVVPLIKQAMPN